MPADEKLKLAAEAAEKAAKAAAAGELLPETFEDYLNKWVYGCKDQAELLDKLGDSRLLRKQNAPAEVAPVAQVALLEESVRVLEGKLATATGVSERLRRAARVAPSELCELLRRSC